MDEKQVFISSEINKRVLKNERTAVRKAISEFPHLRPWGWEEEGVGYPEIPMEQCLLEVENSYAFVLIVGRRITDNTGAEYNKAIETKTLPFIYFKQVTPLEESAINFKDSVGSSWRVFKNAEELYSLVFNSLKYLSSRALDVYEPEIATNAPSAESIEQ